MFQKKFGQTALLFNPEFQQFEEKKMNRTLIISAVAFCLMIASLGYFVWLRPGQAEQKSDANAETEKRSNQSQTVKIAAPGVVESVSEEIEVGAEIAGKLKQVPVEEGDFVTRGQTIAILENADYETAVAAARSQIEVLRSQQKTARARFDSAAADKLRIANGARVEERREARAAFDSTIPTVENASREVARRQRLFAQGDVSLEEFERAKRDFEIAEKRSQESLERFNTINAVARTDDLAKADASIKLAEAQIKEFDALILEAEARVREARARLQKTVVRAPVSGVIVRKRLKTGESVSPENSASGIVTIADVSALRVRVDVDERDVAQIRENQRAFVTADAYGANKFTGKVIKIGQILGRKNFRTERPTERVDTKILEVLIELDANQRLPLGLRVDAFIGE